MKTLNFKKSILGIFILLGMSASAQNFHYGIKGGLNLAVQSKIADYYNNENIRTGMQAGIFGNYAISDRFSLQSEFLYEQKGSKTNLITNKYDYLSIPILVKYSIGKSLRTPLMFNFDAGAYGAYLVNAESGLTSTESTGFIDLLGNSNKMQAGVLTGIEIAYPLDKNAINLDIRLELGLSDYAKNIDNKNNKLVSITLGYQF